MSKQATTGGKFDPSEQFCYFLATGPKRHTEAIKALPDESIHVYPHVLVAVNEVNTVADNALLDELIDGRQVLIDSGIFNLTTAHARAHNMTMDEALTLSPEEVDGFTELYDRYCTIATTYADRLWGIIELDLGGKDIKPMTRARIVADTGVIPIPVFHPRLDGWAYYDDLATNYDRVCVGNLVKTWGMDRVRLLHALYERSQAHPDVWHHLLGVTPSRITHALPIHGSSDSSTWLNGVRWAASWTTGAMGATLGNFPTDLWFSRGAKDYHRIDGIALASAAALEDTCRAVAKEYQCG